MHDLAVSYAGVYLFLGLGLGLGLIIPTCRTNLVLRVIWQCDISGTTPAVGDAWVGWSVSSVTSCVRVCVCVL